MAVGDVEVEITLKVTKEEFLAVKSKVKEIAKFVKTVHQSDEYFNSPYENFMGPKHPFKWIRIGKRGGKIILNYKHWHPENVEVAHYCDEYETEVADSDQLEKIFSALKLKSLVTVEKTRDVYNFKDEFEIALDKITDLGHFIEVEAMKDFGGEEETIKNVKEFAKKLGIAEFRYCGGYPMMLMRKKGLVQ